MTTARKNYTAFANFLSSYPDILSVKRFRELQIRNLLFYQAELAPLAIELKEIELRDSKYTALESERVNFRWSPSMAQDHQSTSQAATTISSLYCQKMLQIRRTLASYNNAVEQYKRLNSIPVPEARDLKANREWLNKMGQGDCFLAGDVEDVWDDNGKPAKVDDFYAFEDNSGIAFRIGVFFAFIHRFFHRGESSDQTHHLDTTSSGNLNRATSTIIASVLPVLPIIVLYFVKSLLVRIGLIIVFTAIFAAILTIGLQLKAETTLATTTAIAAIQVVYVGSTASNPPASS